MIVLAFVQNAFLSAGIGGVSFWVYKIEFTFLGFLL